MKISRTFLHSSSVKQYINKISQKTVEPHTSDVSQDVRVPNFVPQKKLMRKLVLNRLFARFFGDESNVKYYNLDALDGLQKGIPVFKGLSLKQIAFLARDLHIIAAKRGCNSGCIHCYAGAKTPLKDFNTILFEDFKAFMDGYNVLKKRSGIDFFYDLDKSDSYKSLVFDSDNIDIAVKDLANREHLFTELNTMFYKTTGVKGIFDTSGWNVKSSVMQQRAEKIVDYYTHSNNIDEIKQFNISINPFHSMYVKSLELKEKGYDKLAEDIYNRYIDRISNALFTCIPLFKFEKFNTIIRALDDGILGSEGYNYSAVKKITADIYKNFEMKCNLDLQCAKKHIKNKEMLDSTLKLASEKLDFVDTKVIPSKKIISILKKKNPKLSDYTIHDMYSPMLAKDVNFRRLKTLKHYKDAYFSYLNIVDINGKVYMTDNLRIIPTDMQLNFLNRDKNSREFSNTVNDFVFTKDML